MNNSKLTKVKTTLLLILFLYVMSYGDNERGRIYFNNLEYTEVTTNPETYIKKDQYPSSFHKYLNGTLPTTDNLQNYLIFRQNFLLPDSLLHTELYLFIPETSYPYSIYINSHLIAQKGTHHESISYNGNGRGSLHHINKMFVKRDFNTIAILVHPHGNTYPLAKMFIGTYHDVAQYEFTYTSWHHFSINAFVVLSFVFALIYLILWYAGGPIRLQYLYFAIACLALSLSYINNLIQSPHSNELFWLVLSRISFGIATFAIYLFALEYIHTSLKHRFLNYIQYGAIVLLAIFSLLFISAITRIEVDNIFDIFSNIFITPFLILIPIIFLVNFLRFRNIRNFVVTFGMFVVITASIIDLILYKSNISPFIWYLPFGYFTFELCIVLVLGIEQRNLLRTITRQSEKAHIQNKELIQARKNAEHANGVKNQFLANMSHEIRTPLSALIGISELLQDSPLDQQQKEYVNTIHTSSSTLMEIVNDILDITLVESGKLIINTNPMNIITVINNAVLTIKHKATEKKLPIEVNSTYTNDNLLLGDQLRVSQILFNLLGNAIKFTHTGSIKLTIAGTNTHTDALLTLTIADTGIGMTEQQCKNLFKKFDQGDNSVTREYGGTGLGLALTNHIIALMGGNLSIESKKNSGTICKVTLPFKIGDKITNPQNKTTPLSTNLNSLNILVVEDNQFNSNLAIKMLQKFKITPDIAENGEIALQKVFQKKYDLVFMDCQMPIMDGYTATENIRQEELKQGLPRNLIIALTANAMKGDEDKCIAAGMDDFLSKPINKKVLTYIFEKYNYL